MAGTEHHYSLVSLSTSKTMGGGGSSQNGNGAPPRAAPLMSRTSTGDLGTSPVVRATEGWLELFLTPPEKYNFSQWEEIVRNRSLVHKGTKGAFTYLAQWLPDELAPNLITLAGFVLLGNAWYLTNNYGEFYPVGCTVLCCAHILVFFVCNGLTGLHADRIRQHTALSDFFKYACDSCSTVWLLMLTTYCLGAKLETQWYAVQASQLVLLLKHFSAFKRNAGLRFSPTAGPGEVLVTCLTVLTVRVILGPEVLYRMYDFAMSSVVEMTPLNTIVAPGELVRLTYYVLFVTSVIQALLLKEPHGWTRFGLITSLLVRLVPALLLQWHDSFPLSTMDVICDGFFVSVLTSDVILAKMAGRELHPWVVLMSLAAVLSYSTILVLVAVYYVAVFSDLCFYMNLPLLATCRNVYCDGVYDLCHIGHKLAFQNALCLGNRLFVGVVGDEDASTYKRPPVMTHAERCAEVEACKSVTKVIQNAPCFGLTQEFLDQHQIHVVAFGEEYLSKYPNPDDDPYYGYVRKIGIAQAVPRTNTLSTTDLIARIHKASAKKNSPT